MHRRLISPAVSLSSISAHFDIFNRQIRESIDNLPVEDEFFDISIPINICKMTMFLEASLGTELEINIKEKYLQIFAE